MSIISALATYLKTYTGLETGAPVWVNYLGPVPTEYAIVPLPGARYLERYLSGGFLREYPFAFQLSISTSDDPARIDTEEFAEAFSDWMDSQSEAGILPSLGTKKEALKIEASNWGFVDQEGESDTGVYLIQCKLTYSQEP